MTSVLPVRLGYKQKTTQIWEHLVLYSFTLNMKNTLTQDQKIAKMTFASIYPHYVNKIEKKTEVKMNYTK